VTRVLLERGSARVSGLERLASSLGVEVVPSAPSELDALCRGTSHQGAVAFAPELEFHPLPEPEDSSVVLALDGIQDPQNFGAAIRSAVGVAAAPLLWAENASAPLSLATFRASAGAIEHVRLCRVPSITSALGALTAAGYQVIALDAHADAVLGSLDLGLPTVLVVGSEGRGLGRAVRRACTHAARLELPRVIDSLNVSVAAALGLYELSRQRCGREPAAHS
jgi:23S rRNA (guanosine2251-2'-O)-methyltransferase